MQGYKVSKFRKVTKDTFGGSDETERRISPIAIGCQLSDRTSLFEAKPELEFEFALEFEFSLGLLASVKTIFKE